jgi:hypothetical protein
MLSALYCDCLLSCPQTRQLRRISSLLLSPERPATVTALRAQLQPRDKRQTRGGQINLKVNTRRSACITITLGVFVASKLLPYFNVVRASFGEGFAAEEAGNLAEGSDSKEKIVQ